MRWRANTGDALPELSYAASACLSRISGQLLPGLGNLQDVIP